MPYDPNFISGLNIPLPSLSPDLQKVAYRGGIPIDHLRFSIIFHELRDLAICTAHNIDGSTMLLPGTIRRENNFRFDPTVPREIQVDDNRGYRGEDNPWDRGHLVRRRSMHWGDIEDARIADKESFYWTNIAPQHNELHDAWGLIEDWMLDLADDDDKRVAIFTGPIFGADDARIYNAKKEASVIIPAGFWKIIVLRRAISRSLSAAGFIIWQRDFNHSNPAVYNPLLEQVRITTIEFITHLDFGNLRQADPLSAVGPPTDLELSDDSTPKDRFIRSMDDIFV